MEATHEITGCYFPHKGEVDLTWKDIESGEVAALTTKVSKATGNKIAAVIMACVYQSAVSVAPISSDACIAKGRAHLTAPIHKWKLCPGGR